MCRYSKEKKRVCRESYIYALLRSYLSILSLEERLATMGIVMHASREESHCSKWSA